MNRRHTIRSLMQLKQTSLARSQFFQLRPRLKVFIFLKNSGIAPIQLDETKEDIIDEAIKLFRINVLYKNYEIKGNADRLVIFLTVLIQRILEIITLSPKKEEADKNLAKFAMESIPSPGEGGFFMGGIVAKGATEVENTRFRDYLKQLKAETIRRISFM